MTKPKEHQVSAWRHWTAEDADTAIALRRDGKTASQISRAMDGRFSRSAVISKLKKLHEPWARPEAKPKLEPAPKPKKVMSRMTFLAVAAASRDRNSVEVMSRGGPGNMNERMNPPDPPGREPRNEVVANYAGRHPGFHRTDSDRRPAHPVTRPNDGPPPDWPHGDPDAIHQWNLAHGWSPKCGDQRSNGPTHRGPKE